MQAALYIWSDIGWNEELLLLLLPRD